MPLRLRKSNYANNFVNLK